MNSFTHLHQPTGRLINYNHQDYLFFGGTAYLGLLVNREYKSFVEKGLSLYGLNNGTSRSNNVQLGIYDEGENFLASRFGFEDSALFSSGYLAAQAIVKSMSSGRTVFYAPNSHPALWLSDKPAVLAESFAEWLSAVVNEIDASKNDNFLLIANAIDNLKPELYDFSGLKAIDSSKNIVLILDDSHGLGIVNPYGVSANISALDDKSNINVVVVASLAKGFGTDAGVVMGNKEVISLVKKSPIFMGASPSSPAFIYALVNGAAIFHEAYEKLQVNISKMQHGLKSKWGISGVEKFPVFTSLAPELYDHLLQNKIIISSFPYPLPSSPLLNRIVISALHTEEDIQKLTDVLQLHV